jgi:hypothetical protein
MTEPRTATGRSLRDGWRQLAPVVADPIHFILAIEAEAIDIGLLQAFDDVQAMDRAEAASPDSEALRAALERIIAHGEQYPSGGPGPSIDIARAALTPEAEDE